MKYFFSLLILTACAQPKFHYNDRVVITRGFYSGLEGNITEYSEGLHEYRVHINYDLTVVVYEQDLKKE